jgi:L-rhamnose-H+ transport protein
MSLVYGFILTVIAGNSTGYSMLPLKWERVWKWENFWLVYTLVSLLVVPPILAYALCPGLWTVYASLSLGVLLKPFAFGALWGFAQLGAGLCAHRLGFALQGALLGGIGTAVGTLVPMIMQHPEMVFQSSGMLVLGGTAITLTGVTLCGWAGYHREQLTRQQGRRAGFSPRETAMSQNDPTSKSYLLMVIVAVVSGVLSAFTNIALAYGGDIMARAREAGAAPHWAPFAVWPIALLGGSLVNLAYAIFFLSRNKGWRNFGGGPREGLNPMLGGCMWMGGIALYSSATTYLGVLGVSIGFAVFTIILILCGQLAGWFTGEWSNIQPRIFRPFAVGVMLLFVAIVTFGAANYFST